MTAAGRVSWPHFLWRMVRGKCLQCGERPALPNRITGIPGAWCRLHDPRWEKKA
jgi:hypothetical protein